MKQNNDRTSRSGQQNVDFKEFEMSSSKTSAEKLLDNNSSDSVSKKPVSRKLAPFEHPEASFEQELAFNNVKSPLYKIRKRQGLTLHELSKASGISASYLSRIEAKARRMNEEVIQRLCVVLKCTPGQLLSTPQEFAQYEYKPSLQSSDLPVYQIISGTNLPGSNPEDMFLNLDNKIDSIFRPVELTAEPAAFAFKACNDINAPKIRTGDTLYIHPNKTIKPGMTVFAITKQKKCFLGEFISESPKELVIRAYGSSRAEYKISSENIKARYSVYMIIEGDYSKD